MASKQPKTIHFRGRAEPVLETFRVRGRNYFALEKLGRRNAYRVFDPHSAPGGGYRVLYRLDASKMDRHRFEVLRSLAGRTRNRNFPVVVDVVTSGGDLFVVLEWIDGTPLQEYLQAVRGKETPAPSISETVRLIRGLSHGVAHFHRRTNIIHGDISPANILITSGSRHLVLVDFGSAWPIEWAATRTAGDGVTALYAAPERQAHHAAEDFRSDIFSLTAIAFQMLTQQIPYDGLGGKAGLPGIADQAEKSYRSPSSLITHKQRLPRSAIQLLDSCVDRGLRLHPDERFETPSQWLDAWDGVHRSLEQGSRLSPIQGAVLTLIESVASLFGYRPQ